MITGEEYARGGRRAAVRSGRPRPGAVPPRSSARAFPAWLRVADSTQRSLRRPVPIGLDLAVTGAAAGATTGSEVGAAAAVAAMLFSGLLFGVWKRRSSVAAQGFSWYMRRVLPCAAVAAVALDWSGRRGLEGSALAGFTVWLSLSAFKAGSWAAVSAARRRGLGLRRAVIVGPERRVAAVEYRIHLFPEAGLVCARSEVTADEHSRPSERIARLVEAGAVDHLLCTGDGTDPAVRDAVRLAPPELEVTLVTSVPLAGAPFHRLGDLAVVCLGRPSWGSEAFKRVLDVVAAVVLLATLGPLMLLVALAIRLGDPGPAVFRQLRTGRYNGEFTIYKFRSMVADAEALKPALMDRNVADGCLFKAVDDPRVTRVGAFIRRFSIDELPQLLNVLRGDMSLVGPRPLPSRFEPGDLYARRRHEALPGITGLWQVKGANALPYEEMLDLDCAYVATRSLGLDLRILLQTLPAVAVPRSPY